MIEGYLIARSAVPGGAPEGSRPLGYAGEAEHVLGDFGRPLDLAAALGRQQALIGSDGVRVVSGDAWDVVIETAAGSFRHRILRVETLD